MSTVQVVLVIKKRKGFIKLALEHGADLGKQKQKQKRKKNLNENENENY